MISFHSKSYHHPRWPLVKNTISCTFWFLIGMGILMSPVGHFRWVGLAPFSYGLGCWFFSIRPRWKHVIILDEGKLKIGDRSYDWEQFNRMEIERKDSHRSIRLTGEDSKLDIRIKDDLPGFDELAQDCFYHMNRNPESSIPLDGVCPQRPKSQI